MNDHPSLGSRRRDNSRKSLQRLWLWTAISLLALSAPAWADERPRPAVVTVIAPVLAPTSDAISVTALFADHDAVGRGELAAQRGGTGFAVPVAQTSPQTTPQIILWDELKAAAPAAPAGAGQGTNRINIQIR